MKRYALVALILGAILLAAGLIIPLVQVQNSDSTLIGVEEAPTFGSLYALALRSTLNLFLVSYGGAIMLSGLICLLFGNAVQTYCGFKTTFYMLLIALVLAVDVNIGMIDSSIVNIIGNIITVFFFLTFFGSYTKHRKENKSVKGFLLDLSFAIAFIYPFLFTVQEIMMLIIA